MIALPYIVFFGIYLLLYGWLTDWAARKAKARGIAGWKWGLPMALVLYNLVFWDWLPMETMFKYHCATESGFTVYKTLDEWKRENPGVAETLVPVNDPHLIRQDNVDWYFLNQRFAWSIAREEKGLHIIKRDERIVDRQTGEVLAQYVDFSTDIQGVETGGYDSTITDYKIWLMKRSCEAGDGRRTKPKRFEFSKFMYLVKHQKEYEK